MLILSRLLTAFNAPIAGALFVLEKLVRKFEPRIALVALGASLRWNNTLKGTDADV